jgi:hypothetical protein
MVALLAWPTLLMPAPPSLRFVGSHRATVAHSTQADDASMPLAGREAAELGATTTEVIDEATATDADTPEPEVVKTHVRLSAVDASTGAPLPTIHIVQGRFEGWSHPGDLANGPFLVHNHAVPIDLELASADQRTIWWIGSPGYGWFYIQRNDVSGEWSVPLEQAGELELSIVGAAVPEQARVRIRRGPIGDNYPIAQFSKKPVLRVPGLPTGQCTAALEIGSTQSPLVLAECQFEIQPGMTTTATLAVVERAKPPARRRLHGTIELPELAGSDLSLSLSPKGAAAAWATDPTRYGGAQGVTIDLAAMHALGARQWKWDAGEQFEGTWTAGAIGWRTTLQHDALARDGHRLVMPELCTLRVRFVDADTAAPLVVDDRNDTGWWSAPGPNGEGWGWSLSREAPDRFVATLPRCEVTVDGPESLMLHSVTRRLDPGVNEIVMHGRRAGGIQMRLQCGDEEVFWYFAEPDLLRRSDGTGATRNVASDGRITALEPGELRLHIPDIDGYAPIPDRTVHVRPGEWPVVTIELTKR